MRSGVGLCVLALLCLHSSVFGQEVVPVHPGVLIFCDDPSVEKAVTSAVNKFNEKLSSGHKLALYQILTASKSENGAHSVYSLQFTTRRSDCLVGDNKPWIDCNYLPFGHQSPISCIATVHMSETDAETKEVDCLIDHVTPEKAPCLGCPVEIDENSDDIRLPLYVSITKFNSISNDTHLFTLHTVGPSTRQIVAGWRFKLKFDMRKTKCAKAEHKNLSEQCVYDEENELFVNCESTVDVAPWRLEPPEADLKCEEGPLPSTTLSRRRPPGWSPLRHFLFEAPPPSLPKPANAPANAPAAPAAPANAPAAPANAPAEAAEAAAPTAAPTKASAKQESSEEDTKASKSTSATGAAEGVNNSPFHCPSKPWKPFHPIQDPLSGAPTKATAEETSPKPPADGAFSDKDLLA